MDNKTKKEAVDRMALRLHESARKSDSRANYEDSKKIAIRAAIINSRKN